jgi:hypothetical protein
MSSVWVIEQNGEPYKSPAGSVDWRGYQKMKAHLYLDRRKAELHMNRMESKYVEEHPRRKPLGLSLQEYRRAGEDD